MTIAAHFFASPKQASYLYPLLSNIAKEHTEDEFIFLTEKSVAPLSELPSNCKVIPVSPSLKNGLLMHYWYNFKLPSILKKHEVTVFITESAACSLRTNTAQILLIKDISFLQKQKQYSNEYSFYIKKFFRRFIHKAASILAAESYMLNSLVLRYPFIQQKINYAGYGLDSSYRPLDPVERQRQLDLHTDGYEYFICECSSLTKNHIIPVLKAYSIFKKRLKSNMRLVLLLKEITADECIPGFNNYKYRDEVKILAHESASASALLVGAAYAFIYLPSYLPPANMGLNAMQSAVPLITYDSEYTRSVYKDAALFCVQLEKEVADCMMLLYKDEGARKEYIQKGSSIAASYNWHDAANRLWQTISTLRTD